MQNFIIQAGRFRLELGQKTCIMGILNATPDSFSDGGRFNSFDTAVQQGQKLVRDGADILDIGGESSRPYAEPVSEQEELDRVIPVIETLSKNIDIPISIDTVKAAVAKEALNAGASIINDISALEKDPDMAALAARKDVPVILMHMKGTPETMQIKPSYDDLMAEITDYLDKRAESAIENGIKKENIILDPGIGFGKTIQHNLVLIKQLKKAADLGYPLLMGVSRKNFIQKILSENLGRQIHAADIESEYGTMAASAVSVLNGAHIIRVHDVEKIKPLAHILDAVKNA